MIYSIDRFEEDIAICENDLRESIFIPINKLPPSAKTGDCIYFSDNGDIIIDYNETQKRKEKILELQKRLFKHNK